MHRRGRLPSGPGASQRRGLGARWLRSRLQRRRGTLSLHEPLAQLPLDLPLPARLPRADPTLLQTQDEVAEGLSEERNEAEGGTPGTGFRHRSDRHAKGAG